MKHLYFVRHGECELNLQKVFAGRSDSPLTQKGKEQAKLAAKDILDRNIKIDLIVSSSLWRANETAVIIAEELGLIPDDVVITSELFIERNFGMLEGTERQEFFNAYSYQDIDNVPRAETVVELHARAKDAYEYIKSLPEDNILVVSHSAFYRAFVHSIKGGIDHEYTSPFTTIKNATVYELI